MVEVFECSVCHVLVGKHVPSCPVCHHGGLSKVGTLSNGSEVSRLLIGE